MEVLSLRLSKICRLQTLNAKLSYISVLDSFLNSTWKQPYKRIFLGY